MKKTIAMVMMALFVMSHIYAATPEDVYLNDYYFTDVAYNGEYYVAVGAYGLIGRSSDLQHWELQTMAIQSNSRNLKILWNGTEFLIYSGPEEDSFTRLYGIFYSSPDGITWTQFQHPGCRLIAYINDTYFITIKDTGTGTTISSTGISMLATVTNLKDLSNYTEIKITVPSKDLGTPYGLEEQPAMDHLIYLNGTYIAYQSNYLVFSNDLVQWEGTYFEDEITEIAYIDGKYIVYSGYFNRLNANVSYDLQTWTNVIVENQFVNSYASFPYFNGESVIAVGWDNKTNLYKSYDGIHFDIVNEIASTAHTLEIVSINETDFILKEGECIVIQSDNSIIISNITPTTLQLGDAWWNGKQYMKRGVENGTAVFMISDDLVNWSSLPANQPIAFNSLVYEVKAAGNTYIARDATFDSGPYTQEDRNSADKVYILDSDMNLIHEIPFGTYVWEIGYVNGYYYARAEQTYRSLDGGEWEPYSTQLAIPIANTNGYMVGVDPEYGKVASKIFYYKIFEKEEFNLYRMLDSEATKITFESKTFELLNSSGQLFYAIEDNLVRLSLDGVYWYTLQLPDTSDRPEAVYEVSGKLQIDCQNRTYLYDLNEIIGSVSPLTNENTKYVKVNGNILGFDTPPVTESDRTLVPMRFLFEQLGAQVEWDEGSATAIASQEGTTIQFSVDNTMALVNGANKTMDVPARLVGDKTMIPLRFLTEELGYTVQWDEATKTVTIL